MKKFYFLLFIILMTAYSAPVLLADDYHGSGFGRNLWLRSMENQPFIDLPGELGKVAFGGAALVVGVPLVMLGETFYFPFSGQRYFYPSMKQMYFSYYDFVMNDFRYAGYYLLATPFYIVKLCAWDCPIYLYESVFGADIQDEDKDYPKTIDE